MTEPFSASRADRLMACPASGNLDVTIPGWVPPVVDHSAGAKGKGTEIHEILEKASMLTPSDLRHVITSLEYCAALAQTRRFKHLAEYSVEADWLVTRPRTTMDRVMYVLDEIHVIDWKTGRIPQSVFGNKQMLFYARCAAHLAPNAKGVWVHIVQPWAGGLIESRFITTTELEEFTREALAVEQKLIAKAAEFHVTDHCKFCAAFPHSRGDKGWPLCPTAMSVLYPVLLDEEAILKEML